MILGPTSNLTLTSKVVSSSLEFSLFVEIYPALLLMSGEGDSGRGPTFSAAGEVCLQ